MLAEARAIPGARRLVGIVDPGNAPSTALLRKLGMAYVREISFEGYDHPDHVYALDLAARPR